MFAIATAICQIFQTQVAACFRGWQKTRALETLCFYCKYGVICRLCIYCLTQSFEHSTTSLAYVQHLHQIVHYVYVFSSTSWCLLINVLRFSAVFLPAVCGTFPPPPPFFSLWGLQSKLKWNCSPESVIKLHLQGWILPLYIHHNVLLSHSTFTLAAAEINLRLWKYREWNWEAAGHIVCVAKHEKYFPGLCWNQLNSSMYR